MQVQCERADPLGRRSKPHAKGWSTRSQLYAEAVGWQIPQSIAEIVTELRSSGATRISVKMNTTASAAVFFQRAGRREAWLIDLHVAPMMEPADEAKKEWRTRTPEQRFGRYGDVLWQGGRNAGRAF